MGGLNAVGVIHRPMDLYNALMRETQFEHEAHPEIRAWKRANLPHVSRGLARILPALANGCPTFWGTLHLRRFRPRPGVRPLDVKQLADSLAALRNDWSPADTEEMLRFAEVDDFGLASTRVVTTAGVNFLVSAFQNGVELELLRYHGIGTGATAEAIGDTALVTELTTQLNPDSTRATGTLGVGASANVFRTIGTNTVDAAVTITEHGVFSQAATGGGTLLDRSVFAGVGLSSGNTLQTTYDLTLTAGS